MSCCEYYTKCREIENLKRIIPPAYFFRQPATESTGISCQLLAYPSAGSSNYLCSAVGSQTVSEGGATVSEPGGDLLSGQTGQWRQETELLSGRVDLALEVLRQRRRLRLTETRPRPQAERRPPTAERYVPRRGWIVAVICIMVPAPPSIFSFCNQQHVGLRHSNNFVFSKLHSTF